VLFGDGSMDMIAHESVTILSYGALLYSALLYSALLYSTLSYSALLHSSPNLRVNLTGMILYHI